MRPCTSSCRTYCPTDDASPCRNARHNDRRLDACRLAAVSSHPRTTARWDLVEVAASRAEEGDREFLRNDCFDGKSIRQCERVLTFCRRTADHPRRVETLALINYLVDNGQDEISQQAMRKVVPPGHKTGGRTKNTPNSSGQSPPLAPAPAASQHFGEIEARARQIYLK